MGALSCKARNLFTQPGGSREAEWKAITAPNAIKRSYGEDGPAVRVYRGKEAKRLKEQFPDRIIPSRWHEKWKDRGDEFNNGLNDPLIDPRLGAKSRWILQGFHDPDIHLLNRSVPTPDTQDVPLALQLIASIRGLAYVADVKSAFTQSIKGQRTGRLFASAPPGGIPGIPQDEEVLIEVLGEIYGLISGPPGWRRTVLTELKDLGFRNHPLAPCVVLLYSDAKNQPLVGVIVIETDDFLMGGLGSKWDTALGELKRRFEFGTWTCLRDAAKEYGGRTIKQLTSFGFHITMTRYLKMKVREIQLARGRGTKPLDDATPGEVTGMRGLVGGMAWSVRQGQP